MSHTAPETPADATATGGKWSEFRHGWKTLVACSVGLALGLSPHAGYTLGLIAGPVSEDQDWLRGSVLGSTLVATLIIIFFGSTLGRLVDTYGPRKVALLSTLGIAFGLTLLAMSGGNVLIFNTAWGLLTLFGLGTLPMTYAKVITRKFNQSRGLALGLMLSSTGIAGAIYPFYVDWWITAFSWRAAFLGLALLPLLISLPVQFAWLHDLESTQKAGEKVAEAGHTLKQALLSYRFWASAIAAMLLNAASGGLMTNFIPILTETGLEHSQALQAFSVLALSITGGRLLCGLLLDRIWAPLAAMILIVPAVFGLLVLNTADLTYTTAVAAVILVGLITGAEFDLMAFITGRYFGRRHYSEIYGLQFAIFAIGSGVAPMVFGYVRDITGSYDVLLLASAGMFTLAGCLFLTMGRYPQEYDASH